MLPGVDHARKNRAPRRSSTSGTAPTAPCVRCSSSSRPPSRSCSCSTTCTGRCGVDRAARRAPAPPVRRRRPARAREPARARCPRGCRGAERAARAGRLTRIELAAPGSRRRRAIGDIGKRAMRTRSTPRAAATPSTSTARPRTRGNGVRDEASLAGIGVPAAVAAALRRSSCCRPTRASVLEGAAVAGDPFEPELAAAAAAYRNRRAGGAGRAAAAWTSSAPLMFRVGSASAIPSCAAPSTRRRPTAGGSARTHACRRPGSGGAPATARAHHVERSAARATRRPSPPCAKPARNRRRCAANAARWLAAALRLVPASAPASERVALLFAQARAAGGAFDESHRTLLETTISCPRRTPRE